MKLLQHIIVQSQVMGPDDKKIEAVAKAVAATSKFGTQAVKTTEKILAFTAKVFKEPAEQTAGIIGDRLRLFRWKRQVAYTDKVNNILSDRGVSETRAVPPKFALPVLESASLEDDDDLQKKSGQNCLQTQWIRIFLQSFACHT